ncbi:MAG TPA: hypothetical protein VMZ91_04005 [Candidatus Paceibacterota bacterium]|nr:hypothetical protein [Candidatus Paceibacterota bacterium]
MTLINLIKENLREKDKKILSFINLEKTEYEIIEDMVTAGILKFGNTSNEDKENK